MNCDEQKTHTHTRISIATNPSLIQPDKQQPPTIDENCATGSNNSYQQTANGDIPQQQHAPPLQVSENCFVLGFISQCDKVLETL